MKGNFCTVVMMIFLPLSMNFAQVAGVLGVPDDGRYLGKLLDGVPDLLVENPPVGDHDDRIENVLASCSQTDELVRQPGNGIALAAAGGMLDQIALARASLCSIGQQLAHHIELVVAREDLLLRLLAGAFVFFSPQPGHSSQGYRSGLRG